MLWTIFCVGFWVWFICGMLSFVVGGRLVPIASCGSLLMAASIVLGAISIALRAF